MKLLLLAMLLLATPYAPPAARADTLAPPPPPPAEKKAPGDMEDINKELEDISKTMEGVVKQVEGQIGQLAAPSAPNAPAVDAAKDKAMKLATDEKFLKAATALWQSPERNKMLLIQLGFFLFMFFVKAWRQSKCSHWFKRILVGFFFTLLTIAGVTYVIPLIVLGEPFGVFTGTLWRVLVWGG